MSLLAGILILGTIRLKSQDRYLFNRAERMQAEIL